MPPRILMVSDRFEPDLGGVARSATRTAMALGAFGIEVQVLAWSRALPAGRIETRTWVAPSAHSARRGVCYLGEYYLINNQD